MRFRNRLLVSLAFLSVLLIGCASSSDTAIVTQVIDGDTIVIEGGYRVRYIGIDTPEIHTGREAYGMKAFIANYELVDGKRVRLERDISETDKYGRLLRYVYVNGTFVNTELVKRGLAEAKAYPPDTKYQDFLGKLEKEARQAGRGMWAK